MAKNFYILSNKYWKLEVEQDGNNNFVYRLYDQKNNVNYSDLDYHYSIITSKKRGSRFEYLDHIGIERNAKHLESRSIYKENDNTLVIEGIFQNTNIKIKHIFELQEGNKWLIENLTISNQDKKKVRFGHLNFGFEKMFFKQYQGWQDHLDEYFLTPIPSRRFHAYAVDRRISSFSANDLLYNSWVNKETEMPGFYTEGWLWGNDAGGLLTCKYNPSEIEFSRFEKSRYLLPGRGMEDTSIIFGGFSILGGDPERATELSSNKSYSFGASNYALYEGDYKEGYYLYRNYLEQKGHHFKSDYNPPVHWNELYNLGWASEKTGFFVKDIEFERYTLEQLYEEAELARNVGAEALYVDPGWDTFLGSEIWDEKRFGPLKDFSRVIHEKYGLKLALHLMMNFEGEAEEDYFYLISQKGVKVVADPYINLYCVCANEKWVAEKSRRILELAKNNIDFFMFDFTDFSMFMVDNIGCCNKEHGHEVPMMRQSHVEGIFKVIQNVKKKYPNILIEAHHRGVEHPDYFQHALPYSFDENWGFECMWNSLEDLLSHKAFQLYEYNLAYSIPLYLHINENSDNENMVQFWWYTSVARHLGIGGLKDKASKKYNALKKAIQLYKRIKPVLSRGSFYGIDPTSHFHLSESKDIGVIITVNLTSRTVSKKLLLNLSRFDVKFQSVEIHDGINELIDRSTLSQKNEDQLNLVVEIPPLSPRVLILK